MKGCMAFLMLVAACSPPCAANVLRGSPESMARQNRIADEQQLVRMTEEKLALHKMIGTLLPLPKDAVRIDHRLPVSYRWTLPRVRFFLVDLSREFKGKFGVSLKVNSAVRTLEYQRQLKKVNGNAARGDTPERRSAHLTGAVVDIAKKGMSAPQVAWMRTRLSKLEADGLLEVTEEHSQLVFHVMVIDWVSWPPLTPA